MILDNRNSGCHNVWRRVLFTVAVICGLATESRAQITVIRGGQGAGRPALGAGATASIAPRVLGARPATLRAVAPYNAAWYGADRDLWPLTPQPRPSVSGYDTAWYGTGPMSDIYLYRQNAGVAGLYNAPGYRTPFFSTTYGSPWAGNVRETHGYFAVDGYPRYSPYRRFKGASPWSQSVRWGWMSYRW